MKILFPGNECVVIRENESIKGRIKKQKIVSYLRNKPYEDDRIVGRIVMNVLAERMVFLSYLPYIHAIALKDSSVYLKENQILLIFESSSLCKPSPVIMEVSKEFIEFLKKC